nr:phosphatase PAP2 family protein [Sphingobium subterraneum]
MAAGVAGYLWVVQKRSAALLILASVGSGIAVSNALKIWFLRPRPEIVPHLVLIQTASFPSGHAMNAAVAYLTLGSVLASAQGDRGVRVYIMSVAVALTFVVGFSRIYLGVHWPTDVLAGWTMGSVWALLCSTLSYRLQRSRKSA